MSDSENVSAAAANASPSGRGIWKWLRRFYWMDESMAAAVQDGFRSDSPGYSAYESGRAALATAERLRDAEELAAGRLLLLRAAVAALSRATHARAGTATGDVPAEPSGADFELGCAAIRAAERLCGLDGADHGTALLYAEASELFARARPSPADGVKPPTVAGLSEADGQRLLAALAADGASHLAASSPGEREATARVLEKVAGQIAAPLRADAARVRRVWWSRLLRIGITAAVLLAVPVAFLVLGAMVTGPNLALDRPVTMSSKYAKRSVGHDPSALVDGDRQNLGFHTDRGGRQYVTVDLGATKRIHAVFVYNRTDCCSEKAVPLRIEVSPDGEKYREVAKRTRDFAVWKARFDPVAARHVRLVSSSGDYFHLAEAEVY